MKLIITKIACVVFALMIFTNIDAQNDKSPSPELKQAKSQKTVTSNPPPPPPPRPNAEDPIFKVVEQMPRFPGCENQDLSRRKLNSCANGKLKEYIVENLVYPVQAKKKGIEGMVVVQFIVGKDGSILEPKVIRDLGEDSEETCGDAAMKVIKKMQSELKWVAGKQRGRPVKVQYTLPVKFKL